MTPEEFTVWPGDLARKVADPSAGALTHWSAEIGRQAWIVLERHEEVLIRNIHVGTGPMAGKIDQLAVCVEYGERVDKGYADSLVAQFQMDIEAPKIVLDRFFVDRGQAGQVFVESLLHGFNGRERLRDLFCDDERGIREGLFVFDQRPVPEIISNKSRAAYDDEREGGGANDNQPRRIEKIRCGRHCRSLRTTDLRSCKSR